MYPDLLSLVIFGFVTAMTPGPNNIASSYSGFNFGYKKTLPLILAVISGWTSLVLISNTTFNLEIKELITQMYLNQKNFIFNIKDLSLLLVKDANERFSKEIKDQYD